MRNSLFIISKLCMLAFIILLAQGCQEDYEMIDPPMMTDYDDDLDEEVIMQEGLESYFVTQFGEGDMDGSSWEQALDVAGFRKLLSGSVDHLFVIVVSGILSVANHQSETLQIRSVIPCTRQRLIHFRNNTDYLCFR